MREREFLSGSVVLKRNQCTLKATDVLDALQPTGTMNGSVSWLLNTDQTNYPELIFLMVKSCKWHLTCLRFLFESVAVL
jgi:hypothetical protein